MKKIRYIIKSSALAALALLLPGSLLAGPITVSIDDRAKGPPVIEVLDSTEHIIYVGPLVNNPAVEDGALIVLFGANLVSNPCDPFPAGGIPNQGWRFIDKKAPDPTRAAVDIVWIEHDCGFFDTGSLRVGFNSRKPGTGYYGTPGPNPPPGADVNAGPVRPTWVTLYSDDTLVLRFRGPAPTDK